MRFTSFALGFIFLFSACGSASAQVKKEKGYLVYTDERFYFIPTINSPTKNLELGFRTENFKQGFQITSTGEEIYKYIRYSKIYEKKNFPSDYTDAHRKIWILPVKIRYKERITPFLKDSTNQTINYIVRLDWGMVEYDYDFRKTYVKKIKRIFRYF